MSDPVVVADKKVSRAKVKKPHPQLSWLTERDPRFRAHRAAIGKSMRERGWIGLPLLVHEYDDGSYQAWMGMHRLLAADDANLSEIPIVVMRRQELREIGFTDFEIDHDPWEKRERLTKLTDPRPGQLMKAEERNQSARGF
jgi:hypothetical protein